MEEALKIGKGSATGGFQLFVGIVMSAIVVAIGTMILGGVLSAEEYGLYSVALIPSLMINLFRDWGVPSAMTNYVAKLRTTNSEEDMRNIIAGGIIFQILTGLVLSLVSVILSGFIATTIFHRPLSAPLIAIVSITIFSGSLLTAAQSSFVGFERMEFHSLTSICQAIVKSIVSPLLVILGFGALGAVWGYTVSFILAGAVGSATLYLILFRKLKGAMISRLKVTMALKSMLGYGVPLSISSIMEGFMIQFYSFMMASVSSDLMIGNYQMAINFAVFLTFFTLPISTVLFPTFAKMDAKKDPQLLRTVFSSSVKYTALLLVPATMAMIVLSEPMIATLFGGKWAYAPFFLILYVLGHLFAVFGDLSMKSFLIGLDETKMLMKLTLLTLLIGIPLAFLLIPSLGIVGVILGTLFAGIPSMFLGLHWIWKHYKVSPDWRSSARIFIASTVTAATTYIFVSLLNTVAWLKLIAGGTAFLVIFLIMAPSLGALVQSDINNLRVMFSSLGFVSPIANLPLRVAEKVVKRRSMMK